MYVALVLDTLLRFPEIQGLLPYLYILQELLKVALSLSTTTVWQGKFEYIHFLKSSKRLHIKA